MRITTIGIDQSLTNTGVCILLCNDKVPVYANIKPGKLRGIERLTYIKNELTRLIKGYKNSLAVMEGYSYESNNQPFLLGELGATVKLCLSELKIPFLVVPPKSLKKFVTGHGSSQKDALKKIYSQSDDNLADARGLAELGQTYNDPKNAPRYQLEVIKDVRENPENLKKKRGVKRPSQQKKFRDKATIF